MLWLRVTPPLPLPPFAPLPSIVVPEWTPPVEASLPAVGAGASLVAAGEAQSGSAVSIRPSPSSSIPLEQAGVWADGIGVVERAVVGVACCVPSTAVSESAPAMPTPNAVTAAKPAKAMVSASLCLIGGASMPEATIRSRATGPTTLLVR